MALKSLLMLCQLGLVASLAPGFLTKNRSEGRQMKKFLWDGFVLVPSPTVIEHRRNIMEHRPFQDEFPVENDDFLSFPCN